MLQHKSEIPPFSEVRAAIRTLAVPVEGPSLSYAGCLGDFVTGALIIGKKLSLHPGNTLNVLRTTGGFLFIIVF